MGRVAAGENAGGSGGADNYIFEYYGEIKAGRVRVGKNIEKIYKILTSGITNGEYIYKDKKAKKAIRFIENFCHHSEGRHDLLKLELWQKAIVSAIFGIIDPTTGYRQFREVFLLVARKNGKTLFAAAIMAYMAYIDGEYGAKLYCLAPKLDQADLCYDAFYQIVQAEEELDRITKRRRSDIYIKEFNTTIKKIAFNSKKSDGFNPHFVLNDEMEAWNGDQGLKQYEVMASAIGSRRQPVILSTSTAGFINDGVFDELMRRSTAFLKGRSKEKRILPFLYTIDNAELWNTREELEKANPNLDISVSWEFYKEQIAIASASLPKKAEFLTKYCNVKQNSSVAWLEFADVEKAVGKNEHGEPVRLSLEDFRGCYCVGGIDLSRTTDLTAACIIIERGGINYVFCNFYMPKERYKIAINEENKPYNIFVEKGFLHLSGDHVVDYKDAHKWFLDLVKVYKILPLKIGYDKYMADYLVQEMKEDGFHMDDVYQGTNLTPVLHNFEGDLKDGRYNIGDNALLQSHLLNVAIDINLKDSRMKPVKIEKREHIDGAAAIFDALAVKMKFHDEVGRQLKNEHKTA